MGIDLIITINLALSIVNIVVLICFIGDISKICKKLWNIENHIESIESNLNFIERAQSRWIDKITEISVDSLEKVLKSRPKTKRKKK